MTTFWTRFGPQKTRFFPYFSTFSPLFRTPKNPFFSHFWTRFGHFWTRFWTPNWTQPDPARTARRPAETRKSQEIPEISHFQPDPARSSQTQPDPARQTTQLARSCGWTRTKTSIGHPPTWYLLASISRRKLATHIPWTLSRHGCYVAFFIKIKNAKTVQTFRR